MFYVCHDGSDASLFSFLQAILYSPANVVSEAYAANPGLNQVSESYYGALKHQVNQSPSLSTSDLDSQSKPHANSIMKTPVDSNMPSDVPARQNSLGLWKSLDDDITCLVNNPSSAIPITRPVIDEKPFHIIEISSEWAYCTDDTKVFPPFHPILSFHASLPVAFICYEPLKWSLFVTTTSILYLLVGWCGGWGGVCILKSLREQFTCMPV